MAYTNGIDSPLQDPSLTNDDAPHDSESDLSEVVNPIVDAPSPAASANHQSEFGHNSDSEDDDDDVHGESEDADFDIEDSPAPVAGRDERSSSVESRRPAKRKQPTEEDAHILANPELYGLRRSVCCISMCYLLS
jgi:chromodomain-helicase-DNA-binding protein 1